ncbi:MAG TPA: hypothetical protein DD434_06385, partial [Bacteroidales bacterium]|nr:hypothetical protein [Bacteroidales bacterium]
MLNSKTLHEVLEYSVKTFANNPLMAFVGEKPITFSEFSQKVLQVQEILVQRGIGYQDKVVILSQSTPSWAIAYFAIVDMGAVAVPLLPDFTMGEITNCINHSDAKLIFVSERLNEKIEKEAYQHIETIINLDNFEIIYQKETKSIGKKSIPQPEDLAEIIYTSGTSGFSK